MNSRNAKTVPESPRPKKTRPSLARDKKLLLAALRVWEAKRTGVA